MRARLIFPAVLAASAAFATSAHASATIEFGGSHGFAYAPPAVRIMPGDAVTWSGNFGVHPLRSASAEDFGADPVGDGTLTHSFVAAGVYRFYCLVHGAKTGDNQVAGMSGQVVVTANQPPSASFTDSAADAAPGTVVSFAASGSADPDGAITAYAWDLDGDGAF